MKNPTMQFSYDGTQDYQRNAIASVVDLFADIPVAADLPLNGTTVANLPDITSLYRNYSEELQQGYERILARNNLLNTTTVQQVQYTRSNGLDNMLERGVNTPHFSVEMETGTGKTYVYLRTIYELYTTKKLSKFVIVVPSVAIYEGVRSAFASMQPHFAALYSNAEVNLVAFNSERFSTVTSYARSNACMILLMTIDAFNRKSNRIFRVMDTTGTGQKPIELIQQTQPIVIVDEPQNMESEIAQNAIHTLRPMCVLRYSATHRKPVGVVYQLKPYDALRLDLVKRVQIYGIEADSVHDAGHGVELVDVTFSQKRPKVAELRLPYLHAGSITEREVSVKEHADLYQLSGQRPELSGFRVSDFGIDPDGRKYIAFSNGVRLYSGNALTGAAKEAVFRAQIRATIEQHIARQRMLIDPQHNVKVLSLFFLDRVASYRGPRETALVRRLFEEEFDALKSRWPAWTGLSAADVSTAYFAKNKNDEEADDVTKESEALQYELIMKNKARMLSFDEPSCFIFAHSALREGWDNPNVFQICTLRETQSEMRKRQEIGRGLRICVDQNGDRKFGREINILTVIANDSYEDFCKRLQRELVEDGVVARDDYSLKPVNAKRTAAQRKQEKITPELLEFWQHVARRVSPRIVINTDTLVATGHAALKKTTFPVLQVNRTRGEFAFAQLVVSISDIDGMGVRVLVDQRFTNSDMDNMDAKRIKINESLNQTSIKAPELVARKIVGISIQDKTVTLSSGEILTLTRPLVIDQNNPQLEGTVTTSEYIAPVPINDFAKRVSDTLYLNRSTIQQLFAGLNTTQVESYLRNPEGFTAKFIEVMREVLRYHIVEHLEFDISEDLKRQFDAAFPTSVAHMEHELVPTVENCLYSHAQTDSNVEKAFIEKLERDPQVVVFFKFPNDFRFDFPDIIGNYNPDWAVIRRNINGELKPYLVRETKGTTKIEDLPYAQEKFKIYAAQRCFDKLGVDYRVVDATTKDWWRPMPITATQLTLRDTE